MNAVDAANKAEIAMMHAVLAKKFGVVQSSIEESNTFFDS
jgi:hypothetical protein